MFTCKQVSHTLHHDDYQKLPPLRRFCLKLHVKLCLFCGKFNQQVMETQDMCRCFKSREEELATQRPVMNAEQKRALKKRLAEESQQSSGTTLA